MKKSIIKTYLGPLTLVLFLFSFINPVFATESGHYETIISDETIYIDKYFEVDQDGHWKMNIYLGDQIISTIDDTGTTTYPLTDHLGSPTIITNQNGTIIEQNDYDPLGNLLYTTSSIKNTKKYTGKDLDQETNLQYYGARYLDNNTARFYSVDPLQFYLVSKSALYKKTSKGLSEIISNPQSLNSYSYVINNPVVMYDPDGQWWRELFTGKQSLSDFRIELGESAQQLYNDSVLWRTSMEHPISTSALIGVGSGLAVYGASTGVINVVSGTAMETLLSTCLFNCSNVLKYGNSSIQLLGNYSTAYYNKLQSQYAEFVRKGIQIGEHALNKMNNKQFTPDQVINAFNKGAKYFDTKEQNLNIIYDGIRISLDPSNVGRIIQVLDIKNITDRFIKL